MKRRTRMLVAGAAALTSAVGAVGTGTADAAFIVAGGANYVQTGGACGVFGNIVEYMVSYSTGGYPQEVRVHTYPVGEQPRAGGWTRIATPGTVGYLGGPTARRGQQFAQILEYRQWNPVSRSYYSGWEWVNKGGGYYCTQW